MNNEYSWKPDILILGPGGNNEYLHLGSIHQLQKEKFLSEVKIIVSCSIGSLIALLLLIGYKPIEIVFMDFKFKFFEYLTISFLENIHKYLALPHKKLIRDEIENRIKEKLGTIPTLKELYSLTEIDFYICVYDLKKDDIFFITHETNPDLNCVDAILSSSSIPFLTDDNFNYIDGAFANPYPVEFFDNGENKILGLLVDDNVDLSNKNKLFSYLYKIAQIPNLQLKKRILSNLSENCKHIFLKNNIIDPFSLLLSNEKYDMVANGFSVTGEFLKDFLIVKESNVNENISSVNEKEEQQFEDYMEKIIIDDHVYYKDKYSGVVISDEDSPKIVKTNQIISVPMTPKIEKVLPSHKKNYNIIDSVFK